MPVTSLSEDHRAQIASADCWVTTGRHDLAGQSAGAAAATRIIRIPEIYFPAFHPDLVYISKISTGWAPIVPHYNSGIIAWAFVNGLDPIEVPPLFNSRNFAALGYFSLWDKSVAHLRKVFANSDLDFAAFFLPVKRNGNFMHTINHPKIETLQQLARLCARRMGGDDTVMEKFIHVPDALNDNIWPLYPELAHHYSLSGDYNWLVQNGGYCDGLATYIHFAYNRYLDFGLTKGDVVFSTPVELYDDVLGKALRG
ncbi:hypothetical protein DKG75_13935 [Zavarzinia compransoris]|uniref:Polysaccharide biosynthesis enzyme WcbI domain-containing protein n=1 Tax=Zavarzinia compransoris TaxID=1264899 RepID=A0A317DYU4_9PROT|nr:hypothetical protein DKG75_13935 [Zavarzinia compransoris]